MSALTRYSLVIRQELGHNVKRPLFWIWALLIALLMWGMSDGNVQIATSGDNTVDGDKQWLTSEFAFAYVMAAVTLIIHAFFASVAAGMSMIKDEEWLVDRLLHGTSLGPREYVWSKFAATLISTGLMLTFHVLCMVFFFHVLENPDADASRGPLVWANYLRPAAWFGAPVLLFLAGSSFAVGTATRKPILVFVLPVVVMLVCGFFLWTWTPHWLDPQINRALMAIDPTGSRWLGEMWMRDDLGVDFYNTQPIGYDGLFIISRIIYAAIGLGAVGLAAGTYARMSRSAKHGSLSAAESAHEVDESSSPTLEPKAAPACSVTQRRPSGIRGTLDVIRFETRELRNSPGLYIFVPIIIIEVIGTTMLGLGAFDTPMLLTSGYVAASTMNLLIVLICLLLMFYTVESQQRESHTRLAPIAYSTSVRTTSIVLGKMIANAVVAAVTLSGAFLGGGAAILSQGMVSVDIMPFVLVWGLLLLPTFIVWSGFVSFTVALTRNRYTTYGIALAVLMYTYYRRFTGDMNWIGNWDLMSTIQFSDISTLELDRWALIVNRVFVLSLAAMFTVLAVRVHGRREFDSTRLVHRFKPRFIGLFALRLVPWMVVPAICAGVLLRGVNTGRSGARAEEDQKDYWRQNVNTWFEAPVPILEHAELDVELDPVNSSFVTRGTYRLRNDEPDPMRRFSLTGARHWRDVEWTYNGEAFDAKDQSRLYVFAPDDPIETGEVFEVGFSFHGRYPDGISVNGGGMPEFILPSSVVLTSFRPTFSPVIGFIDSIGVDDENQSEPREFEDDHWKGITPSAFLGQGMFTTHITVHGPAEYLYHSVGRAIHEDVTDGKRTVTWESDYPVNFFNIVAGKWAVHEGEHSTIYHHPEHDYNLEAMSTALDASRTYYSEWFMEYPWEDLRLNEFAGIAGYAQGFPTNITFSETIGFLTRPTPEADAVFLVTAHEAAHQWWGNLLLPGTGPGGNVLSEGTAHFSTILLMDQVKGLRHRIGFCVEIEDAYNEGRRVNAERPLIEIDGTRPGDTTVTYDKGGWVFWMVLNHLGRERGLEGYSAFVNHYHGNEDHPLLQDFVAFMREYAEDQEAYDAFTDQWFFEVVLPQYRFEDVEIEAAANGTWLVRGRVVNMGTGFADVEIAAVSSTRFEDDQTETSPTYNDTRVTIRVDSDSDATFELTCEFEPERLVVDPDAKVLQRSRSSAKHEFD